ncbi:MAG: NifB/NifX family molybdenum-iron cluster-binding protein [Candidatus Zixiibacteriota bacterium]
MIKIAIPKLKNRVAPCFEAATSFSIIAADDNRLISQKTVHCSGSEGYHRVRLMKLHDINLLLCNGIGAFYSDLLHSTGIRIICDLSGIIHSVLKRYLSGGLKLSESLPDISARTLGASLNDLISWSRDLFEKNGYVVTPGPGKDSFLIDLVAEMNCSVCGEKIRVAVCCGAHTYRPDQEIREFHYTAKPDYNARVFISPDNYSIEQYCREYGIEFIRSDAAGADKRDSGKQKIPLLHGPVEGHENAFGK